MDPAIHEIIATTSPGELVEAVALLRPGYDLPPPARAVTRFGQVVTCRVAVENLVRLRNDAAVESLKASRLVAAPEAFVEFSKEPVRTADERRPAGIPERGSRTVLGFLDWGCDFAHPNFRRPDGSTRLLALWDQRQPRLGVNRYGYGTIWDAEAIDRALRSSDPYAALGYHPAESEMRGAIGSHGTHVMDTAAGSGRPLGIAPDASLIFVHLAARDSTHLGNLGESVRVLEGVDLVRTVAGIRPWVCNLSLGRTGGEHSGRSLVERALDHVMEERPGCAIAQSCGNYFSKHQHAEGWIPAGGRATLEWFVQHGDLTPNELEIWLSGRDRVDVELTAPGGERFVAVADSFADVVVGQHVVGRLYHRAMDPVNLDNHVDCFLSPSAPPGRWHLTLHAVDVLDGRFHAWIERDLSRPNFQSSFPVDQASPRCTLNTIASSYRGITTGAVDSDTREPAAFSSAGPTRDGRIKPDLAAPGTAILAARSTARNDEPGTSGFVRMSGTSSASPQVAGTIALMFDAAPRPLAIAETRALLLRTCTQLPGSDPLRTGAGLLNTEAAVRAARHLSAVTSIQESTMTAHHIDTPSGVDAILARGWMALDESEGLTEVLDDEGLSVSPDALFRELSEREALPFLDVIGYPSQMISEETRAGDLLLRVAPGEPGLGHVAVLADGALATQRSLAERGVVSENGPAGRYALVIEGGAFPHAISDSFARRVTDVNGFLPSDQMVIRIRSSVEEEVESADAENAEEDRAASAAVGRQLRLRLTGGIAVAVFLKGEKEFERQADVWARREDALGVGKEAIVAHKLRFGKAIADQGDLKKLLDDLKTAMDEALKAALEVDIAAGKARTGDTVAAAPKIRALALFSHGWSQGMQVCDVDSGTVKTIVDNIADRLAENVNVILFGCSVARGSDETDDVFANSMNAGGKDSLAGLFRDALADKNKTGAEVWGHTEVAHTTTNPSLRRFAVRDGKQTDGVSFAGSIVFTAVERTTVKAQLELEIVGLGFELPSARAPFDASLDRVVRDTLYRGYRAAIFKDAKNNIDNRRLLEDNLAEMAPLYTQEVTTVIKDFWTTTYWTPARRKEVAKAVAKSSNLRKKK